MKTLATMAVELPEVYDSYRRFVDANVFGEGEQETEDRNREERAKFMKNFYADVEEEKARRKEKAHMEWEGSPKSAGGPSSGPGGEQN